jgi:hypothetical protein
MIEIGFTGKGSGGVCDTVAIRAGLYVRFLMLKTHLIM